MNAARKERLKNAIANDLVTLTRRGTKHLKSLYDPASGEGPEKWSESSVRTRVALALAQSALAAERAKTMSEAPRALGVIVIERRLADTPENRNEWETEARQLADSRAIEAVTVPKEPNAA